MIPFCLAHSLRETSSIAAASRSVRIRIRLEKRRPSHGLSTARQNHPWIDSGNGHTDLKVLLDKIQVMQNASFKFFSPCLPQLMLFFLPKFFQNGEDTAHDEIEPGSIVDQRNQLFAAFGKACV
ncbi:MAG: hypothetical protein H0Z34_10955 [Brevibacillus sp.]|nr:hypothetical protein [Brevibacillus sp.]